MYSQARSPVAALALDRLPAVDPFGARDVVDVVTDDSLREPIRSTALKEALRI